MRNLIKYEVKGYLKETLGLILVTLFFQVLLLVKGMDFFDERIIVLVFVNLVAFGSGIVTFIWNIKLFSKDLYEDTSYLIYTVPESMNTILASKFISSLVQTFIVVIINLAFVFNYLNITFGVFKYIKEMPGNFILTFVLNGVITYLSTLAMIYFSITLSKISIRKKSAGKFGAWVIFLIISSAFKYIQFLILDNIPGFQMEHMINNAMYSGRNFTISYGFVNANIIDGIFNLIIFVILFFTTSYLLRDKLDI